MTYNIGGFDSIPPPPIGFQVWSMLKETLKSKFSLTLSALIAPKDSPWHIQVQSDTELTSEELTWFDGWVKGFVAALNAMEPMMFGIADRVTPKSDNWG